jgi:hypothetical protein
VCKRSTLTDLSVSLGRHGKPVKPGTDGAAAQGRREGESRVVLLKANTLPYIADLQLQYGGIDAVLSFSGHSLCR